MISKNSFKWVGLSIITLTCLLLAYLIFGGYDFMQVICWYGMLSLMTVVGLPLTLFLFRKFYDGGYIFSKTIGILLSGFLMWLLSSLHILKFNTINCYICVITLIIISLVVIFIKCKKDKINYKNILEDIKPKISHIVKIEIAFLIVFLFACYVKGFHPHINNGTEQFMDYGYMAIMDRTDYMPPIDMWLSGKFINYYYFGQYISTFLTKTAQVGVNYGYNLMLITLFVITFFIGFSICFNLLSLKEQNNTKKRKYIPFVGGAIGSLALTLAGNMHYVLYSIVLGGLQKYFTITVTHPYYYPDSTRYIGYTPDVADKTIHEFPSYSFTIGDLHAHVINMIFVLTLAGLLVAFLLNKNGKTKKEFKLRDIFNPIIVLSGFLIGIFKMTNFWDYPIYFVVTGAIVLFSNILTYEKTKDIFKITLFQAILVFIVSNLVSLPFTINFVKMASEIRLAKMHTPLFQLLVLWGLPSIMVIYYIYTIIKNSKLKLKDEPNKIRKILSIFSISDLFIVTIGLCAIGLVLVPEVIYVRDIYDGGYSRANTMFKLTYQAYLLFAICFGYILLKLLLNKNKIIRKKGIIFTILFTLTLGYPSVSIINVFGNIYNTKNYKTLDGMYLLENGYDGNVYAQDDLNIINWLNENANKNDVILETYGDSYTYSDRISVFTGLATPLGWTTHEYLWRSKGSSLSYPVIVEKRTQDIDKLYSDTNIDDLKKLVKKYNISYIIVGNEERKKHGDGENIYIENEDILKQLGDVVYSTNLAGFIFPTYIIKIDNERL